MVTRQLSSVRLVRQVKHGGWVGGLQAVNRTISLNTAEYIGGSMFSIMSTPYWSWSLLCISANTSYFKVYLLLCYSSIADIKYLSDNIFFLLALWIILYLNECFVQLHMIIFMLAHRQFYFFARTNYFKSPMGCGSGYVESALGPMLPGLVSPIAVVDDSSPAPAVPPLSLLSIPSWNGTKRVRFSYFNACHFHF